MSAPTQVLPSWLTLSTTVVTLPDGGVFTSSTTLQLPLTYFGPSIPLGTDGVWTYGGLTPPPSTTSTSTFATPTSPVSSSVVTTTPSSSSTIRPTSSSSSSLLPTSSSTSSTLSTTTTPTASSTTAAASSHAISPSTLGAILGSILGTLLLLILIAIIFLLRQARKRRQADPQDPEPSSSFWNRSTTLMSFRASHQPIWTGWDLIEPRDLEPSPPRSPGEGSPRESGDERDPFLTRGSTEAGHTRTDTDTLVSLPIIARTGTVSSRRSISKPGPIIPRDVQLRMADEMADAPPYPSVRMVERRPSTDVESPLLPPRPIDPDSLGMAARRASNPSVGSEKRSFVSDKSLGSLDLQEAEGAQMLTARRVQIAPAGASTGAPNVLGLDRLASLGRMSWFRRMSFLGTPPRSDQEGETSDPYTRTPPRHSRNGSRSRPTSFREPTSPTTDSFGRRLKPQDSAVALGERPVSSVSAVSEASGNTVFFDARSRPGSSMGTRTTQGSSSVNAPPMPPVPSAYPAQPSPLQREVRGSPPGQGGKYLAVDNPPTYEAATRPHSAVEYSDIDVLDMPVPRPASPFSAASGLRGLPDISVWRNSVVSSTAGPGTTATESTTRVDVLDQAPPSADNGWSSLSGGGRPDGRRLTFGVPMVVQPPDTLQSERGSLHSMRSHLSPHSSHSPSGSAAASSRHTMSGSNSSRPSISSHSRGPTGSSGRSLGHTSSVSFDDHRPGRRRAEVGEVSPPLSAVFSRGFGSLSPPPTRGTGHPDDIVAPTLAYPPGMPLPPPVAAGTVTSRTTDESLTDLSVTTTQTDPITGAVVHLPRLPWRSGAEAPWGERPLHEDTMW